MGSSEVEKIFPAFAESRKAELPRFTPDGIPITPENKFDDGIYAFLYNYWKEHSREYDPKKDVIPESEMNKMHPKTKNEFQFEQWLFEQYGMTSKEKTENILMGNLNVLLEVSDVIDIAALPVGAIAAGAKLVGKKVIKEVGEKAVKEVAEEAVEKTVKREVSEEVVETTIKKEMADTAEDLSQKNIDKDDILKNYETIKKESEIPNNNSDTVTYRRVQGGTGDKSSQPRIVIDKDGNVYISNKTAKLNVSIDNGEHAQYYIKNKRPGGDIYEFEVPKWLDDMVQEYIIPQRGYRSNPLNQGGTAPSLNDIETPGICVEFPAPWIEWIEEYASNGRIIKGGT